MRKLFAALAFLFCVMACDKKADLDAEKKQNQDNGRVINMLSADIPADGTADYSAHISEVFSNLGAGSKVLFFPKGAAFSDDDARLCKIAAHMAALHPFQVTNIE